MKLKTEKEIGFISCEYADQSQKNRPKIAWVLFDVKEAYKKGYTQAQQDLLASASEDWDEWWENDKDIPEMLGRASEKVAAVANMAQRCSLLSEFWAREAWQAVKLSDAKEIETLKRDLKYLLKGTEYFRPDMKDACEEIRKRHNLNKDT